MFCNMVFYCTFTIHNQKQKHMNSQSLTNAQKIVFNYDVKFWIQNGLSKTDAEKKALDKLIKLKNNKSIVKY
jgi:hypothetical protein